MTDIKAHVKQMFLGKLVGFNDYYRLIEVVTQSSMKNG